MEKKIKTLQIELLLDKEVAVSEQEFTANNFTIFNGRCNLLNVQN